MSEKSSRFEHENAGLFAKIEETAGRVDEYIGKVRSAKQRIKALEYEQSILAEEKERLKKKYNLLKQEYDRLKSSANVFELLEEQNFTIRNKITKIVSNFEGSEVSEEDVKELLQSIIGEVDECIRLLKE
ncbi:hypothetical protein LAG90_19245 [Marinilongibacter aquaticus]|uniref:hypothetical protein n=1 Tax=Marinilongibacter aquaticus TaxID=2975157 RepID=UPI0021BD3E57|nr:hypothetical protein [Marinilongibacter aquaticus]UBM58937.1 hypothetical protein LAG90_19245 [Marinilongibacter aquaticus]